MTYRDTGFSTPDKTELLEFFGAEPVESDPADGFWVYELTDAGGVTLRFSFDVLERSVQTEIRLGDRVIAKVSYEGAVSMRCDGRVLRCEFRSSGTKATLAVDAADALKIEWATLRA
jgi:hypothetical protein